MKVLITGATGFVGKYLAKKLIARGDEVLILTRSLKNLNSRFPYPCKAYEWDSKSTIPKEAMDSADAVVHLAGESVAGDRWTEERKKRIYDSRIDSTKALVGSLTENQKAFVCASAIGIYGDRGEEELTEDSPAADSFLANVCKDWEQEACKAREKVRTSILRIGIVLGRNEAALKELVPIVKKNAGGPIGSGKHWMSWIHIEDLCRSILYCLDNENVSGVFNAVQSQPIRNKDFHKALAVNFESSFQMPAPSFALKLVLGEMATIVLSSQKVFPKALLAAGFCFQFEDLALALKDLYPSPNDHIYEQEQWFPQKKEELFPFFSEAKNLEAITPDFLNFKVDEVSTEKIQQDTEINYSLKLHGFPFKWKTLILDWQPPNKFVDNQEKGPYSRWHHTHEFIDFAGGTLMTDRVFYRLPVGSLGDLVAGSFVHSDVKKIFQYRFDVLEKKFKTQD